jgi:myosin-3
VAVKILENILESMEEIEEEYMILKEISYHPNLPQFYGLYLKKGKTSEHDQLWLVMELCAGGSTIELVRNLRNRGEYLTEMQIIYIIYNTLQVSEYHAI